MKTRVLFWVLAGALALLAFMAVFDAVSSASRREPVLVARTHLLAGAMIGESDVEIRPVHPANVPPGALMSPEQAVGRQVLAERLPGDILTTAALGEAQAFPLAPDEVAIAVAVDRVTGLSGLLRPGDRVSIIGILSQQAVPLALAAPMPGPEAGAAGEGKSLLPYARIYLRGVRVLFIHHEFAYVPPAPVPAEAVAGGLVPVSPTAARQAESGIVVLAAPVGPVPVSVFVGTEQRIRFLSPAELIALLNASATVHLALDPRDRADLMGYGVRMADILPSELTVSPEITTTPEVTP